MADTNANETKDQPVTISAPPAASVTIDPQNPLPEASFTWRRIITICVCATMLALDWYLATKLHDLGVSSDLLTFAKWNIVFNGLVLTYYFVAPSAAELTNIVQSASIIRHSLTTAAETAANRAESGQASRFAGSGTPESQIPASGADEAPGGLSGDLAVEHTPEDIPQIVGASDPSSK